MFPFSFLSEKVHDDGICFHIDPTYFYFMAIGGNISSLTGIFFNTTIDECAQKCQEDKDCDYATLLLSYVENVADCGIFSI